MPFPRDPPLLLPLSGPGVGPLTVQRNGTAVTVTARGSTANVVAADVGTGAGIVHVVDTVLLPFYRTLLQVRRGDGEAALDTSVSGPLAPKACVRTVVPLERVVQLLHAPPPLGLVVQGLSCSLLLNGYLVGA